MRIIILLTLLFQLHPILKGQNDDPVYYTSEKIANARENIKKYKWAKAIEKRIFEGDKIKYYIGAEYGPAKKLIKKTDDFVWSLQPSSKIPRIFPFDTKGACPNCGEKSRNISFWCPWEIDPLEHPYKIKCKNCGKWFPSNDYIKGDMDSGKYPDNGDGIFVNGKRYYMLREYSHFVYLAYVIPLLSSLSEAYLLTGNETYARKGCILLARLASEYPNYEDRFERTYCGAYGGTHPHYKWKKGGMMTDFIWENSCLVKTALAYDALKTYMSKDKEMISFLQSKGIQIKDGEELKTFIKESIFRPAMKALLKGLIQGNEGLYQSSALAAAMTINDYSDSPPNTKDMVDFVYCGNGHAAYVMENTLWPDGGGHESPGYNTLKFRYIEASNFMEAIRNKAPEKYPAEKYPEIWRGPKGEKVFDYFMDIVACGIKAPSIGDSGMAYPGIKVQKAKAKQMAYCSLSYYLFAANKFKNPRFRKMPFDDNAVFSGRYLWEKYPESNLDKDKNKLSPLGSRLLDFYGAGFLESGKWPNTKGLSLNYSALKGHRQADSLTLGLYGFGYDLLPDLGYPVSWDYKNRWDYHNMGHNTVTVDELYQNRSKGICRMMASTENMQVLAAAQSPYQKATPDNTLCERIDIMAETGKDNFYVIDIFSVNGGSQHDQSWHSMPVPVKIPQLEWIEQNKGTLAGKDVSQFGSWKDKWNRKRNDFPSFLTNIKKAPLNKVATWTWETGQEDGVSLKIHAIPLTNDLQAIMGKGRSPVWAEGKYIDYVLIRRELTSPSTTRYLSVLEAYKKTPFIKNISVKSTSPLVINVEFENGYDEYNANIPEGDGKATALRPISIKKCSYRNGKLTSEASIGETYITAKINKVDYNKNQIKISIPKENIEQLKKGGHIRIYNDKRSACYRILKADIEGDSLLLELKDSALLARGVADNLSPESLQINTNLVCISREGDEFCGTYLACPEHNFKKRLKGAFPDGKFMFETPLSPDKNKELLKSLISVYQYGVGDSVEIPIIKEKI
jgi:hypothetical protein